VGGRDIPPRESINPQRNDFMSTQLGLIEKVECKSLTRPRGPAGFKSADILSGPRDPTRGALPSVSLGGISNAPSKTDCDLEQEAQLFNSIGLSSGHCGPVTKEPLNTNAGHLPNRHTIERTVTNEMLNCAAVDQLRCRRQLGELAAPKVSSGHAV
jgi:hypothetical protein